MKKLNLTRVLMWVFAILPLLLVALVYNRLPELVPTRWGLNGEVSYGGRSTLWWLSGMSPALAAMFVLLPKIDPRKESYTKFQTLYDRFALFMMVFMLGIVALVISESLNPGRISVEFVIVCACGVMFMFIGNMLPKVKSNFFVGVKTPWTLSSSEVWNKTHRLAGYLFFFSGPVTIASAFFLKGKALFTAMMAIVIVTSAIPGIMSYVWFREEKRS